MRPRGGPLALDGVSAPRPPKPGSRGAHDGAHDGARQVKRRSLACERERRLSERPAAVHHPCGATVPLSRAVCPVMIGGVHQELHPAAAQELPSVTVTYSTVR